MKSKIVWDKLKYVFDTKKRTFDTMIRSIMTNAAKNWVTSKKKQIKYNRNRDKILKKMQQEN